MRRATEIRGHHRCNARSAFGTSRGVYARILAIQMGVRGASFECGGRFFSMQAEFCHFGHETARRLRGMAAGMREVRSQSLAVCV